MKKTKKTITTKRKVTTKPKTQIAIILDRSGSMQSCGPETVQGLNEQIRSIQKNSKKLDTRVSLVTFATTVDEPKFFNEPATALKEMKQEDYVPDGWTAMYDAVGKTIDRLLALKEGPDTSFLLVIISDGMENYSKEFTREAIAKKVQELQDKKTWTFTYLGANQNLADISKHLHIPMGNIMAFASTPSGMKAGYSGYSGASATYMVARAAGATQTVNFYQKDPNAKVVKK